MSDLIDRDALLKDMGLTDAVKYGNKNAEQQDRSYSTWMSYEIADSILDAPAVNRWIPCSEQMMPDGERVLVYLTNGEVFVMRRSGDEITDGLRHITDLSGVERWMPMPDAYEPPESEVQE